MVVVKRTLSKPTALYVEIEPWMDMEEPWMEQSRVRLADSMDGSSTKRRRIHKNEPECTSSDESIYSDIISVYAGSASESDKEAVIGEKPKKKATDLDLKRRLLAKQKRRNQKGHKIRKAKKAWYSVLDFSSLFFLFFTLQTPVSYFVF